MTPPPAIGIEGRHELDGRTLFDVALDFGAGDWTCLLGPSGAGKSTILRLLLGLETGGRFEGRIAARDGGPLAGRIGYMAQTDLLLPWLSVADNVMLGARLRGETPDHARAHGLIGRVGLAGHAQATPATLSGGMRQRAALARVLMEDQPVILLDEPFSALDAGTRADMQELAAEVLTGRTVLLVTHDPAEAIRLADRIVLMSDGGAWPWPVPGTPAIRSLDAPETLDGQARLLAHLRAGAR